VDLVLRFGPNNSTLIPVHVTSTDDAKSSLDEICSIINELESKVGIMIGKKISLFYKKNNLPQCIAQIELTKNNEAGQKLCSYLFAETLEETNLLNYMDEIYEENKQKHGLEEFIDSLLHNQGMAKSTIIEYLIIKGYNKVDVEDSLADINVFAIDKKSVALDNPIQKPVIENRNAGKRDNTRFSFDNSPFYTKREFVLQVIKRYVKDHPDATMEDLEVQFPSEIISKTRGVVRPLTLVKKWIETNPDVAVRFELDKDKIITLKDGMEVVVHNQWGAHFPKFLRIAKTLYDVTSDKPYQEELPVIQEVNEPRSIQITETSLQSFSKNNKR
jgi:hypothetical protein